MLTSAAVVEVDKAALDQAYLVRSSASDLPPGGARLRIDSFAITANNVTYAQVADRLGYWTLFPATPGRGIVPVWGHATVEESPSTDLSVGERVFGLLPMATHLDIVAGSVEPRALTDMVAHRSGMSPFYNRYARLGPGPSPTLLRDRIRETFQPLFATGYRIEQAMREHDWYGAKRLIVTSASSKTALALAHQAARSSPHIHRLGLTSVGNLDYVVGTGLYDGVVSYDRTDALYDAPSVLVDFAGDPVLRRAVHERAGDQLKFSCSVGVTHASAPPAASGEPLPGPVPQFFFAPTELERAMALHGADRFQTELGEAFRHFADAATNLVTFDVRTGIDEARNAYLETLAGQVRPSDAIIIRP